MQVIYCASLEELLTVTMSLTKNGYTFKAYTDGLKVQLLGGY